MPDSYNAAIARHQARRWEAYAEARDQAIARGLADTQLRLTDIDRRALDAWRRTWSGNAPVGGWRMGLVCAP